MRIHLSLEGELYSQVFSSNPQDWKFSGVGVVCVDPSVGVDPVELTAAFSGNTEHSSGDSLKTNTRSSILTYPIEPSPLTASRVTYKITRIN